MSLTMATVVSIKNLTLKNRYSENDLASTETFWEKIDQDSQVRDSL